MGSLAQNRLSDPHSPNPGDQEEPRAEVDRTVAGVSGARGVSPRPQVEEGALELKALYVWGMAREWWGREFLVPCRVE